jgi:hypothetical protein
MVIGVVKWNAETLEKVDRTLEKVDRKLRNWLEAAENSSSSLDISVIT